MKGEGNQVDFGERVYDPRVGRFLSVDPMSMERVSWTPYNSMRNNPINNIDPTGALDEWVQTGGEVKWDDRVKDQKSAERIYGKDAKYRAPDFKYTAKNGDEIQLGEDRLFTQNGELKRAVNSTPANTFTPGSFDHFYQNNRGGFDSRVEGFRAWQGEPGEHEGESVADRLFRVSAFSSMEARREFASGGMDMYSIGGRISGGITARLQSHVTRATQEVDALGNAAFTARQLHAIQRNPALRAMYRGNRIDVRARTYVKNDPSLQHLKSNYTNGPDFVDPSSGRWWDITTKAQWQNHVNKYGSGGTLLKTN